MTIRCHIFKADATLSLALGLVLCGNALVGAAPFLPTTTPEDLRRHQLFVECRPIAANIGTLSPEIQAVGLTKQMLERAVELRLRASGIYAGFTKTGGLTKIPAWLDVEVRTVDDLSQIHMAFVKFFYDPFSGLTGPVETWTHTRPLITRQANGEALLFFTKLMLELFLQAFFEVNEPAC